MGARSSILMTAMAILLLGISVPSSHALAKSTKKKIEEALISDVEALSKMEFDRPTEFYLKHFGNDPRGPFHYFMRVVGADQIAYDDSAPKGVLGRGSLGGKIELTRWYKDEPQVVRIAALLHEAFHVDKGASHIWCPSPYTFRAIDSTGQEKFSLRIEPLDNAPTRACDRDENGAYGFGYGFLQAIYLSCSNCSQEIKDQARETSLYHLTPIADPRAAYNLMESAAKFP